MKRIKFLVLCFSFFCIWLDALNIVIAEDKIIPLDDEELSLKKSNYQIDQNYKAGSYLIYNCENGHYACVDKDGFTFCKNRRDEAKEKMSKIYPCSPISEFASKTKCAYKNYEVIEELAKKRFCYPKN
jgi:hypothetical protein